MPETQPQEPATLAHPTDLSLDEVQSVALEIASLEAGDIGFDEFCARIAEVHAQRAQRMH